MAKSNDPFGGAGSSSGGGSSSDPFASSKPKAPSKRKPRRWGWALLDNLEDFARGIGPGIAALGKAAYNDADRLVGDVLPGNKAGSFQLDDIGGAVVDDYKTRYRPLFKGDIQGFLDQVATKPLDFILDAATIATLGVGAAVTVPTKFALAGAKGATAAKAAKWAGYVERTPENVAKASQVYGSNSRAVRAGEKGNLVRGVREVGGDRLGQPLLKGRSTNPVLGGRDAAIDKVLGAPVFDNVPLVGLNARAARQDRRRPQLTADVARASMLEEPSKRLRRLNPDEQTAWFFHHTGTDPREYADLLRQTKAERDLDPADGLALEATLDRITRREVLDLYEAPSTKLAAAITASRALADEQMPELLARVTTMGRRAMIQRRMLQRRKVAGARVVDRHPEQLQPTKAAERAKRQLVDEERRRGRTREQTAKDVERMVADGTLQATRLRATAARILERLEQAGAARAELEAAKDRGRLEERPMTREDALKDAPERVRRVPVPGREPTPDEVRAMIQSMRNKLTRGRYGKARGELRRWLAAIYMQQRYGTTTPDAAAKQAEAKAVRDARARRRGRVSDAGHTDLINAIDKFGLWDARVSRLAEEAGPYRTALWKQLKRLRAADERFRQGYHPDSLEYAIARAGFHPTDRNANPADDDTLGDRIEEWLDEQDAQVADVARGAGSEARGRFDDAEQARALIELARFGDPDLPANPTNDDVADGIAAALQPDEGAADIPTQKAWIDQAMPVFLRIFEADEQELADAAAEFGRVRGRADRSIADQLGIRSADDGVEPTPGEWARAIRERMAAFGFDEDYRKAVASVAGAERDFDVMGSWAFRDERFVPDPEQTDFGTMLQFVPELDDQLRAKLEKGATLAPGERSTIRKAVKALEAAARRAERPGGARAQMQQRLARLEEPSRREQRLAARAEQLEEVPLRQIGGYGDKALVNEQTGRLIKDEDAELSVDELAAQAEGASYFPHLPARAPGRGPGSPAAAAIAVKREPGVASNLTHENLGVRFETGNFSMDPMMLLQQADRLARSQHALDLYDRAVARGIPFDRARWAQEGGQKAWVVLDRRGIQGLNQRLVREEGVVRELEELLPEEQAAQLIEKLGDMSGALAGAVDTGELTMVPRGYYERLVGDLQQSSRTAQLLIDRPLDVFRTLVLFTRPAYYVNNVVGQHLLLAVKEGGPQFVPQYLRFLAHKGRTAAARQLFRQVVTEPTGGLALWDEVIAKHARELRGASAFDIEARPGVSSLTTRLAMSGSKRKKAIAAMLRTPEGLNRVGAVLSDDLPRQFRFIRLMQPEVAAARAAGEVGDDAAIAMRLLDGDEVLRERITEQVLDDLIDYRGMGAKERLVVRRIIPFYGWLRGISRWTAELGYNHPGQLLALAMISTVGQDENAEWNKVVPRWLQGAVRIGDEREGMQRVVNTQGMNPLATIADLAAMARGLVGDDPTRSLAGGTALGQINPYAQAMLAATFNQGKELGSPFPMLMPGQTINQTPEQRGGQWPGWPGAALGGFLASTPPATMYAQRKAQGINEERGIGSVVSGTPGAVYKSPFSDYVLSWLGLPVRNVSMVGAAQRRARDEDVLAGEGVRF